MKHAKWIGTMLAAAILTAGSAVPGFAISAGHSAVTTTALNLRKSAGTGGSLITTIKKGKTVEVISDAGDGWWKVTYNNSTGYVYGKYLTENTTNLKQTTAALRLRSSAKTTTSSNILLTIPKGAVVESFTKYTNGWYKVSYNGTVGYASGQYLTAAPAGSTASSGSSSSGSSSSSSQTVKTTGNLNMRSSMSLSSSANIILTIPKGDTVTNVSKQDDGWYKVTYDGKTGYVKGKYLAVVKTSDGSSVKSASAGEVKTLYENLNMRSSMSKASDSNIIDMIRKGDQVTIISQESNGWFKVKYDGQTGYIMGGHFTDDTSRVGK